MSSSGRPLKVFVLIEVANSLFLSRPCLWSYKCHEPKFLLEWGLKHPLGNKKWRRHDICPNTFSLDGNGKHTQRNKYHVSVEMKQEDCSI